MIGGYDLDLQNRFPWIGFYEDLADNLLRFKDNREKLVAAVHRIPEKLGTSLPLKDQFIDETEGPLEDIMSIYNSGSIQPEPETG